MPLGNLIQLLVRSRLLLPTAECVQKFAVMALHAALTTPLAPDGNGDFSGKSHADGLLGQGQTEYSSKAAVHLARRHQGPARITQQFTRRGRCKGEVSREKRMR